MIFENVAFIDGSQYLQYEVFWYFPLSWGEELNVSLWTCIGNIWDSSPTWDDSYKDAASAVSNRKDHNSNTCDGTARYSPSQ